MQQPANPAGKCCCHDVTWQFYMRTLETFTFFSAFVENTNQVDYGINTRKIPNQAVPVVYIGFDEGDVRINNKRTVTFTPAGQYTYPVAVLCQPVDQVLTDKAGTTEDANCFIAHV